MTLTRFYSFLQNYISWRKETVHIKYVSDLGLRLKLGTFYFH